MMKKISFILIAVTLLFAACKPQNNYEIGDPSSKVEGIAATWQLTEAFLVDEVAINKDEANVTNYFTQVYEPFTITFNSETFTYNVNGPTGVKYFGANGDWSFDSNEFPTEVNLTPKDGKPAFILTLLGPIREVDQHLKVQYFKGCGSSAPNMSFKFTFNRINE